MLYVSGVILALVGLFVCLFCCPYIFHFLFVFPRLFILSIRDKRVSPLHFYGIRAFVGQCGAGKTISMTHYLNKMRKTYGDKIYITSNYGYIHQDFPFTSFEELLVIRDKPFIVAWDEVQNEFCSRDFQKFPTSLLTLLTQNRKGHGVQIVYSCQHLSHVDKIFRDMTNDIYFCHTWLNRFTFYVRILPSELDSNGHKKKSITFGRCESFVQTAEDRNAFDSFQILKSATTRGYGDCHIPCDDETPLSTT